MKGGRVRGRVETAPKTSEAEASAGFSEHYSARFQERERIHHAQAGFETLTV